MIGSVGTLTRVMADISSAHLYHEIRRDAWVRNSREIFTHTSAHHCYPGLWGSGPIMRPDQPIRSRMRLRPAGRDVDGELGVEEAAHRIRKPNLIAAASLMDDSC